jgi:hypothetical protein
VSTPAGPTLFTRAFVDGGPCQILAEFLDRYGTECTEEQACWDHAEIERINAEAEAAAAEQAERIRAAQAARRALGVIPPIVSPERGERPFVISFARRAREAFLRAVAVAADGREVGMHFYGFRVHSWRKEIEVVRVRSAGPYSRREEHAVELQFGRWTDWAEEGELEHIGEAHTHSNSLGRSDHDLAGWRDLLKAQEKRGRDYYVALIATAQGGDATGRDGEWRRPELEVYVVRRREDQIVCERAEARIEEDN